MKKFECRECSKPCFLQVDGTAGYPTSCPYGNKFRWHEVEEETVTDCNQLPKLTAEVFNFFYCPKWAIYAAVDKNGKGFYYHNKPQKKDYTWALSDGVNCKFIGYFDPSDWQNSLIKRPADEEKALPDWCKVGEWVK